MITVSQLWTYPFKSGKGVSLTSAQLDSEGMCDDRCLVALDTNGIFITARRYSQLLQLSCTKNSRGWLLQHPSQDSPCQINQPVPERAIAGTLWKDALNALDAGDEAAAWLSDLLKKKIRIAVWKKQSRYSNKYQLETSFADASPLLVTTQASIQQVCKWAHIEPDVRRFRPNIVLAGVEAFAEDGWRKLQIANLTLELLDTCARCILTTKQPDTGESHAEKQPIKALMENHVNDAGHPIFGVNATMLNSARNSVISVGDEVTLIE
jgi:uncharacterized protein YcbX